MAALASNQNQNVANIYMAQNATPYFKNNSTIVDLSKQSPTTVGPNSNYICGVGGSGLCSAQLGPEFTNWTDAGCQGAHGVFGCTRSKNSAPLSQCCLGQATGQLSCAPGNDINNGGVCDTYFQSYCGGANSAGQPMMLNSQGCQYWAQLRPKSAAPIMQSLCNGYNGMRLFSPLCRAWCIANGGCDDAAKQYCGLSKTLTGVDSSFCSCINSTSQRPDCFDGACTSGGYRTDTMRNGMPCGTLITCTQNNNISGLSNQVDQNNLIMNCTNNSNYQGGVNPSNAPAASSSPASTSMSTPVITNTTSPGPAVPTATPVNTTTSGAITSAPSGAISATSAVPTTTSSSSTSTSSSDAPTSPPESSVLSSYEMYGIIAAVMFLVFLVLGLGFWFFRPKVAPPMMPYGPSLPPMPGSY